MKNRVILTVFALFLLHRGLLAENEFDLVLTESVVEGTYRSYRFSLTLDPKNQFTEINIDSSGARHEFTGKWSLTDGNLITLTSSDWNKSKTYRYIKINDQYGIAPNESLDESSIGNRTEGHFVPFKAKKINPNK
jgi:hypothetical protein